MMATGKILYIQYTNPAGYPPLQRSSRLLADEGWKVRFLGLEGWGSHELRFPEHEQISVRWFMRRVMTARRFLAGQANLCILPNEERARLFRQQTGRAGMVDCVWNCPSLGELDFTRRQEPISQEKEPLYLHYHGSIVPSRLPITVVEALKDLPSFVRLQVFGYDPGEDKYLHDLREAAKQHGVWDRVELGGTVPQHSALLNRARRADIGLSFMPLETDDINQRHMVGASNKPFEYLACGLPLLVSNLPEWREMYVEPEYGRACDPNDPEDIVETVLALIQNREALREMGRAGQKRIREEWNYETEFEPVRDRMTSQVG